MNSDNLNKLGFQKKYILGWLIMGVVLSVAFFIILIFDYFFGSSEPVINSEVIGGLLFSPFAFVIIGFGCFLIEGVFMEKFRFSEVKHPQWFWYVYPVSFLWTLVFAIFLGFFINLFTSKK